MSEVSSPRLCIDKVIRLSFRGNVQFNNSRENKSFVASGMFEDVKDLFQKNR